MPGLYSLSFLDYSKEDAASSVRFHIPELTAANIAAQTALIDTLRTSIDAVTLGTLATERVIAEDNFLSRTRPTDPTAQRENKWLFLYEDQTTHRIYRGEIPTANITLLDAPSDHIADLTTGVWGTFKSAFEAVVKSPAGNAVTLLDVQFVGKRL